MQYITGFEHYRDDAETAVTLGKFDGLHRGHRKLVERIMEHVEQDPALKSVVCFFEMTEFKKMCHLDTKKLMMNEERAIRLDDKVDYLIECPFLSVKEMEAEAFIEKILSELFHARYIVVGENFRFGHDRRGDIGMLEKYQERFGYRLEVIPNEYYGDRIVSSTYVREVIKTGNIDLVNRLLSYPYTIAGTVRKSDGMGRKLGYPTMDIFPCQEKILPPAGAFVCKMNVEGKWYQGVCNIGQKPTVSEGNETILSVHLFCYEEKEEAHGKAVVLQLYHYLRPEEKFEGIDQLRHQIHKDIREAKRYFLMTIDSRRTLLEIQNKKEEKN